MNMAEILARTDANNGHDDPCTHWPTLQLPTDQKKLQLSRHLHASIDVS